MPISREQMLNIFLTDADRAKQRRGQIADREDQRTRDLELNKPNLPNAAVGALTGFATGGLGGALAGGLSGMKQKNVFDAGLSGFGAGTGANAITGGAGDIGQQLSAFTKPDNLQKTGALLSGIQSGNTGDAVSNIGKITAENIKSSNEAKAKVTEAEAKRKAEKEKYQAEIASKEKIAQMKADQKAEEQKKKKDAKAKQQAAIDEVSTYANQFVSDFDSQSKDIVNRYNSVKFKAFSKKDNASKQEYEDMKEQAIFTIDAQVETIQRRTDLESKTKDKIIERLEDLKSEIKYKEI